MLTLALVLFGLYLLWLGLLYAVQDRLVFLPGLAGAGLAGPPPGAESIRVPLDEADPAEGEVEAWFLPAPEASPGRPAPAVLFAHGNAELIDHQLEWAGRYRELGVSVLLCEYRGYGRSAGRPGQEAITRDMVRFHDLLGARADVDRRRIVFHGRSIGGGVVADLARRRRPAALVLESTATDLASMAWRFGAPPVLVKNPYRTAEVLPTLGVPVLVLHGLRDEIFPVAHARRLAASSPGSRLVLLCGGHNDLVDARSEPRYWAEIQAFLRASGILPAPR